jgi:Fur family transcriptional regulator, ferric uptake regulator
MVAKRPRPSQHNDALKDHCSRWTGARQEVFDLLVKTGQHLSAQDIHRLCRESASDIGLTTIYRTLELLDKAGLVRKIHTGDGHIRFEYRRSDHADHHHHLICTGCGQILNYRDFEQEELELVRRTEELLTRKHGFLIRDHNIEFIGLCPECRPGGRRSIITEDEPDAGPTA